MIRQGIVFDRIVRTECGDRSLNVLDCTCGIGTQAIGLALYGHTVYGTDVAEAAVKRATSEAKSFGAAITFAVADVRHLEGVNKDSLDVVNFVRQRFGASARRTRSETRGSRDSFQT